MSSLHHYVYGWFIAEHKIDVAGTVLPAVFCVSIRRNGIHLPVPFFPSDISHFFAEVSSGKYHLLILSVLDGVHCEIVMYNILFLVYYVLLCEG